MSRYKLVLTGLEMMEITHVGVINKLAAWVERTGARNVTSGVIRCDADPHRDIMLYSCHFDSAHWTGVGFKGFDVKDPGVPQTL
jgi:hypothetical protein